MQISGCLEFEPAWFWVGFLNPAEAEEELVAHAVLPRPFASSSRRTPHRLFTVTTMTLFELAVAVAVPLVGGIAGSVATADQITTWYRGINKPSWTPPNWLFGPVWTVLYAAMGVASYLVWKQGGWARQSVPLTIYGVQLLLNFLWTPLFFKLHKLGWATADILAMWGGILATILQFKGVIGNLAVLLMGPYLLWVSYAAALTIWIWQHNTTPDTTAARKSVKAA